MEKRTLPDVKPVTVLLIEDSPDYAELVQQWLSVKHGGISFVLNWTDSLASGMARLEKGGVDVILLDLGLPDSGDGQTYARFREHDPGVPVIVLSAGDNESLAVKMIQEGAADYLVKSTCTSDILIRAVRYALVRHQTQAARAIHEESAEHARVVGILGAKGGLGTTTIACTVATDLREQTGESVLLTDLDVDAGSVAFQMGLHPQYSVLDALGNLSRLDASCLQTIVEHQQNGLDVLCSPNAFGGLEPEASTLTRLVSLLQPHYKWVVVDLARLNPISAKLVSRVHDLVVVTTTTISGLYEAKRLLGALQNQGVERDQMRLVLNRVDHSQPLSGSELNRIFGLEVYAMLPDCSDELHDASVRRALPSEGGNFRKHAVSLSRKLAGLPEAKPKRAFSPIRSLTHRFRKVSEAEPNVVMQ